jgi:hypothetical protein
MTLERIPSESPSRMLERLSIKCLATNRSRDFMDTIQQTLIRTEPRQSPLFLVYKTKKHSPLRVECFLYNEETTERQGFEPWDQLPGQVLSRHLHSATLPPLQNFTGLKYPNINLYQLLFSASCEKNRSEAHRTHRLKYHASHQSDD